MCSHKPSYEVEEEGTDEIRVGLVEPKVRPSFPGSHLSCSLARWAIDVVQHVGGEILSEFAFGVFERSPSHLFLYLLLF